MFSYIYICSYFSYIFIHHHHTSSSFFVCLNTRDGDPFLQANPLLACHHDVLVASLYEFVPSNRKGMVIHSVPELPCQNGFTTWHDWIVTYPDWIQADRWIFKQGLAQQNTLESAGHIAKKTSVAFSCLDLKIGNASTLRAPNLSSKPNFPMKLSDQIDVLLTLHGRVTDILPSF